LRVKLDLARDGVNYLTSSACGDHAPFWFIYPHTPDNGETSSEVCARVSWLGSERQASDLRGEVNGLRFECDLTYAVFHRRETIFKESK
jgi:hypothetical protein